MKMMKRLALISLTLAILFPFALCQDNTPYSWLEKADELSKNGDDLYNKGLLDKAEQYYNNSIPYYDKVLGFDPNNISALNGKAWSFNSIGEIKNYNPDLKSAALEKFSAAGNLADKAIELDPNNARAWNNKGKSLLGQDKYDEAIDSLDKAIEIDPQYAEAWNNKGNCLAFKAFSESFNKNKLDMALECWDKAIYLDPNLTFPWLSKAQYYELNKDEAKADAATAKAFELGLVENPCKKRSG